MTIEYLKRGKTETARAEDDVKVRGTVETILTCHQEFSPI